MSGIGLMLLLLCIEWIMLLVLIFNNCFVGWNIVCKNCNNFNNIVKLILLIMFIKIILMKVKIVR